MAHETMQALRALVEKEKPHFLVPEIEALATRYQAEPPADRAA